MKKRILMRASVSPFAVHKPIDVICQKVIGNNTGNLLFAYSMTRTLYTEDVEIDFLADKEVAHGKVQAEYINENYDYLVLPMANSFRKQFMQCMGMWTSIIEKLTIPVIVTGIGIQMPYEPDVTEEHIYDECAKKFITAVLNHSASVGVRGAITESYLKHLGFGSNEIDVTGCPSFAMFGPGLTVRDKKPLTNESAVCVTGSVANPVNFKEFMIKNRELLPNYYFMPQFVDDLRLMYLGIPLPITNDSQVLYPHLINDEVFVNDRARFFINLPSILEFNKNIDFNYGTRIHGAVGSILSGVPSFVFPTDARIRELAEYHNVPNMPASEVDENTDIFDIYEKTDFSQVNDGHEQRFWHFVDFLNANGLPHIYQDKNRTVVPFDEKIKNIEFEGPIHSLTTCHPNEMIERIAFGNELLMKEQKKAVDTLNEDKKELKAEIKGLKSEQRKLNKRLNWYDNSSAARIAASRVKHKIVK